MSARDRRPPEAPPRPPLDQLRVAVNERDGHRVVEVVRTHGPSLCLQMAGDGLLVAVAQGVEGAAALAATTAEALRRRGLEGDVPLAEAIEAALGTGPVPLRAPVPVDLGELVFAMDMDPTMGDGWLHRRTGELRYRQDEAVTGEPEDEIPEDDEDWIWLEPRDSHDAWKDMATFAESLEDEAFGSRLLRAIDGRGAFRCFKDALLDRPDVRERWFAWSEDRSLARARAFLAENGLEPTLTLHCR